MTKIDTANLCTALRDSNRRELLELIAASCVIDTYASDVIGAAAEQALNIIDAKGNT